MRRSKYNFFQKTNYLNSKIVIGLIGDERGVGTTHTALLMANYFNHWVGLKTCYVEFGSQNQIGSMSYLKEVRLKEDGYSNHPYYFIYEDIICYPSLQEQQLPQVLSQGYECIIIDFGIKARNCYHEILRCDRRYLIASLKPWRYQGCIQQFSTDKWKKLRIEDVLVPFGNKKEIANIHDDILEIQAYPIPYEPNPFVINDGTRKVLNQIFQ